MHRGARAKALPESRENSRPITYDTTSQEPDYPHSEDPEDEREHSEDDRGMGQMRDQRMFDQEKDRTRLNPRQ
jgi:hypothetical protein